MKKSVARTLSAGVMGMATVGALLAVPAEASATPANHYGAMALSPSTGNVGSAVNYRTPYEAKLAAMARCGVADCQWVVSMSRSCGAVAQQPLTNRFGWAYAPTRARAEAAARNAAGLFSYNVLSACTVK